MNEAQQPQQDQHGQQGQQPPYPQALVEEWKEIRESLRYFGNKRFAQLTVFIAATGFMLNAYVQQSADSLRIIVAIVGIVLSALFIIMELSSVSYWNKFAEPRNIEGKVDGLELMTNWRPPERWLSGTNATYVIYLVGCVLWIATFWVSPRAELDAVAVVEKASVAMPGLTNDKQAKWCLKSLNYDAAKGAYDLILIKMGATDTWNLTLDPRGRILKASP